MPEPYLIRSAERKRDVELPRGSINTHIRGLRTFNVKVSFLAVAAAGMPFGRVFAKRHDGVVEPMGMSCRPFLGLGSRDFGSSNIEPLRLHLGLKGTFLFGIPQVRRRDLRPVRGATMDSGILSHVLVCTPHPHSVLRRLCHTIFGISLTSSLSWPWMASWCLPSCRICFIGRDEMVASSIPHRSVHTSLPRSYLPILP